MLTVKSMQDNILSVHIDDRPTITIITM